LLQIGEPKAHLCQHRSPGLRSGRPLSSTGTAGNKPNKMMKNCHEKNLKFM
jgi:hypothetical protein